MWASSRPCAVRWPSGRPVQPVPPGELDHVRARLRVYVKRVLREHGYPPDKQEAATKTVLQQAEALSEEWLSEAP